MSVVEADGGDQVGLLGGLGDLAGLCGADPHGLLDPEGLAGLDGRQGHLVVEEIGGADGDRLHLGVGQQLAVVGVGAFETQVVHRLLAHLVHRVCGCDQTWDHTQLREALGDGAVAAGMKPSHPPQGDDSDAQYSLVGHNVPFRQHCRLLRVWRCAWKAREAPVVNDVTGRYQTAFVLTR